MRIETSFLRTRVARRIVALFFLCALLPTGVLAVIAFGYVTKNLEETGRERLAELGRLTKDAVMERLASLETTLRIVASDLDGRVDGPRTLRLDSTSTQRFLSLGVYKDEGEPIPLLGSPQDPIRVEDDQIQQLRLGSTVLATHAKPANPSESGILIGLALDRTDLTKGILWAAIEPDYVLTGGETLPRDTDVCAFDTDLRLLYCSVPVGRPLPEQLALEIASQPVGLADRGHFEWNDVVDETYLAWYQSVFLQAWVSPVWTIVLSEREAVVLAGMADFWKFFVRVVVLALLTVALLSYVQIRKSMDPLLQLREGTIRIAKRDFDTLVRVDSGDEFEDLATSFNEMAGTLRKQFSTLTAINDIDRAVLAALGTERIINTILGGIRSVLFSDAISVSLASENSEGPWKLVAMVSSEQDKMVCDIEISPEEREEFNAHPDHQWLDCDPAMRTYLDVTSFHGRDFQAFLTLPIFTKKELSGVIALAYTRKQAFSGEDLIQARQLADQVAVALSNSRLIEQLDALNVGALTALARTIDASSSWTAGHSERVTRTSLVVGRQLGLSDKDLEIINRGGLLHDIGKIGVPASILDKPGMLNDDEWAVMKSHVTVGARILEPITAYADVIPIVRSHHERWDGTGYPDRLVGKEIAYFARILSVGDVYDALTSNRPYRSGLEPSVAIAHIEKQAGRQFDSEVVAAFLAVKDEIQVESPEPVAAPVYRPAATAVSGA